MLAAHTKATKKERNKFSPSSCTQGRGRTGTGVNLLVFETSASTDSATWASLITPHPAPHRVLLSGNRLQRYNYFTNYAKKTDFICYFLCPQTYKRIFRQSPDKISGALKQASDLPSDDKGNRTYRIEVRE